MALLFKPYQSTVKDKFGDKLFYPRVQIVGNVSTKQIAKEIAEYCSLPPGDVKNTIDNLVRVMATHLQNSNSVTLDGFGTFRIVMKANGKGVATQEDVTSGQARLKVHFQQAFTRHSNGTVGSYPLAAGVHCVKFNPSVDDTSAGNEETPAPDDEGTSD